jgi:SAM-dependent methyltransferase
MAAEDRIRWDAKYRKQGDRRRGALSVLTSNAGLLPNLGRALDLAGGAGSDAIWLARRGLDVTLADISPVALELARSTAERNGVSLRTMETDLERDPFPPGPWDLILCVRFLWRPLFEVIPAELAPGGVLIVVHPTRSNLLRHERPGPQYLLDDGELPGLVRGLEVLRYQEGWTPEGHHEATLIARRVSDYDS